MVCMAFPFNYFYGRRLQMLQTGKTIVRITFADCTTEFLTYLVLFGRPWNRWIQLLSERFECSYYGWESLQSAKLGDQNFLDKFDSNSTTQPLSLYLVLRSLTSRMGNQQSCQASLQSVYDRLNRNIAYFYLRSHYSLYNRVWKVCILWSSLETYPGRILP